MKTLQQFVAANIDKPLDWDNAYGDQCVDLVQFWANNLGTKTFWGNAIDIINQAGTDYVRIDNSPTNAPSPGDIVVWRANGKLTGPYGHVDIAISGDSQTYTGFDQNWYGHQYCEVVNHNYDDVVGWLHPKVLDQSQPTNQGDIMDANQVKIAYETILYREPDPGGLSTFTGRTPDVVMGSLAQSDEGKAIAGKVNNYDDLVTKLGQANKDIEALKAELGQKTNVDPNSIVITKAGWSAVFDAIKKLKLFGG